MNQYLLAAFAAMALCLGSPAHAQATPPARTAQAAPPEADSVAWVTVTVVVEIQLRPKTEPAQAHAAVDVSRGQVSPLNPSDATNSSEVSSRLHGRARAKSRFLPPRTSNRVVSPA
jgi:hypothetical protein